MVEKMMAVRFLLPGGELLVTMSESKARAILQSFLDGQTRDKVLGDRHCPGPWAVRFDQVCSVQLFLQEAVAQHQAPLALTSAAAWGVNPLGRSGI